MVQEGQHGNKEPERLRPFFSEGPGDLTASYGNASAGPGAQIGPYKLLGILGEGGYGIVYLAQQERPIKRRVALKVVKPGMDSRQVIARFEAEKQALALLDHPNLAHVYDAGTTEAGRPYFVMEYIEGLPITEYCDSEKLSVRQRLQLFLQVCQAVQHAHQKGIIHRDLKPSNILVAATGGRPLVKVIDFGIAKALAQPLTEKTLYTQQGQFIGTPDYMSPEQAEMDAQGIDTRSDVYSLGVVLYELLTGILPFDPDELRTGGLAHMKAILRDKEPKTPSTRLTDLGDEARKIAEWRLTNIHTLAQSLRRELEWIPLKAMRKECLHRYQSASELADDIHNYLDGNPLLAGPESVGYRIGKFVRRYSVYVAASIIVILTVFSAMAVVTTFYLDARSLAEAQRRTLYYKNISLIDVVYRNHELRDAVNLLESCPEDLKGWEWDHLQYILDESQLTMEGHTDVIDRLAKHPDGEHIWSCSRDKTIRCWDLNTGQEVHRLFDPCTPMAICVSHSGLQLATGDQVGNISLWDTISRKRISSWSGHKGAIENVSFDCDDSRLLSEAGDQVLVWDVRSGEQLMKLECRDAHGQTAVWSPDGSTIAAIHDNAVAVFDAQLKSETTRFSIHDPDCSIVQFSPDGSLIGVCGKRIWLYDANTGALKGTLPGHSSHINSMELNPDGRHMVTGGEKGIIKVWDLFDIDGVVTLRGHAKEVLSVTFSTDGGRVISCGNDAIKVWDPEIDRKYLELLGQDKVCSIAFSPDSQRLISASEDKTLKVWDLVSASEVLTLCGHRGKVWGAAFTSDGTQIISGSDDCTVRVWDATKGDLLDVLEGHEGAVLCVAVSPDNKWFASAGADHTIKLWDMSSHTNVRTFRGHTDSVTCLGFDAKSSRIVSGGLDHTIRIWDVATGRTVATWSDEDLLRANSVSFASDGTVLLAGTTPDRFDIHSVKVRRPNRVARFWNFVTGEESVNLIWHTSVGGFSPDGTRFVHRRSLDLEVRDALTGDLALNLKPPCSWFGSAVFSPDGEKLAASGYFGGIGVFESGSPPGGYETRKQARNARILVDELRDELDSYTSVIKRIQDDNDLDDSIRHFALQISRSRLSEEQGHP